MSTHSPQEKKRSLHARNRNRQRYDLQAMATAHPALSAYIQPNKMGADSIVFSDPAAVRALNQAILHYYYDIAYWDFPAENLCPPIPGRAEYIHHVADLLGEQNGGEIPTGDRITCLDIGTGASCIYPIIGVVEYQWKFIGSDIKAQSLQSAQQIIDANPALSGQISCRLQPDPAAIFQGVMQPGEKIDLSICNPPFHASMEAAWQGTRRKVRNLAGKRTKAPKRNFSGHIDELVYPGGEFQFISRMMTESKEIAQQCFWFSCLVSKASNLKKIEVLLQKNKPTEIRNLEIKTGNKTSRVLAWTYLTPSERKTWVNSKWQQ